MPTAAALSGDDVTTPSTSVKEEDVPGSATGIRDRSRFCAPGLDQVTLSKGRRRWSYPQGLRLEHNLHWAVGLLELANAGDFAANIWNDTPVPVYAIVFMAIGGTAAAVLSVFALRDAGKAWHNVRFLRNQRQLFREHKDKRLEGGQPVQQLNVLLDITTRELYTEFINRWGMDILMGGGAVLISIGTFLAIGGANPKVWLASNILSGYLGNAPIALYGLVNFAWAMFVWRKKQSHRIAAKNRLKGTVAMLQVKRYCFDVHLYFAINGTAALIGGVGSMLTATRWWAYVILIPVIISSFFCNFWWRKRVGYDRPCLDLPAGMDTNGLILALEFAAETRRVMEKYPSDALRHLVPDPSSLPQTLASLVEHGLFEAFAVKLVEDSHLFRIVCSPGTTRVEITVPGLLALPDPHQIAVLNLVGQFLRDEGPGHFQHRERFIAEVLGTYLHLSHDEQHRTVEDVERNVSPLEEECRQIR
ncbi:hypothetical protein AK830_g5824 [Neonectria ditissima]|uniref:Integral membrane protein n=1 Tax=Neonectria ditissima TaxID=78410 RepID=A0A0P7ASJ9_9HYPO|nr:hypothetical protein AK830_g5824 [Neonectria ditissima]